MNILLNLSVGCYSYQAECAITIFKKRLSDIFRTSLFLITSIQGTSLKKHFNLKNNHIVYRGLILDVSCAVWSSSRSPRRSLPLGRRHWGSGQPHRTRRRHAGHPAHPPGLRLPERALRLRGLPGLCRLSQPADAAIRRGGRLLPPRHIQGLAA